MVMKADAFEAPRPSTKRPILIFIIAIWVFYQKVFYLSVPLGLIQDLLSAPHNVVNFIGAILSWALIVLLLLFIGLRNIPRLMIITFVCIGILFNAHAIIYGITLKGFHIPPNLRSISIILLCILFNISIVYYLTRKKFVKLSNDYRREIIALNKKRLKRNDLSNTTNDKPIGS